MADIRQFSAESQQRIADVVRRVEQSPIVRTAPTRRDVSHSAREVRWARTTTSYAWPSYPTEGPVYVVEFGEYAPSPDPPYPGASVTNSFTAYDPEWKEIAVDPSGGRWEQDSVVRVERHEGRWWIRPKVRPDVLYIKNATGGTLSAGAVVEITSAVVSPLVRYQIVLNGITRAGVDPPCAVLLEDAASDAIVEAVSVGIAVADVDIIDSDNTHARVVPGTTQLRGDFGGWARILHKPSGTGVKTCVVAVGDTRTVRRKARATTTITDGSTGSADVFINAAARGNVTVHFNWMTGSGNIASGSDLLIEYFHDEDKWIVVGAECEA